MHIEPAAYPVINNPAPRRRAPDERPLMQFRRIPVAAASLGLVDELSTKIIANEGRQRKRRPHDLVAFKDTLGRALGDLGITLSMNKDRCRAWPRGKYYYTPDRLVSWHHSTAVYDGLERIGMLVTEVDGYFNRERGDGLCAQVRPTEALRDLMKGAGLLEQVDLHWRFDRPALDAGALPLVLVRRKRKEFDWRRLPADLIPGMELTDEGRRLTEQLEQRNEFIKAQDIAGTELLGWYRTFNEGFEHGGRMFALPRGELSYLQRPEEQRIKLRLNGMAVNEIDLKASHLYFALARKGVDLVARIKDLNVGDPYSLTDDIHRKIVKSYVSAMFGQERHPSRWPRGAAKKLGFGRLPKVALVRERLLRAYPELIELDGIGWRYLQYVESEALGAAMDYLRAEGVPSLPVHDSLIVPQEATGLAVLFLKQACRERAGYAPPMPEINRARDAV
jgi:hypothetical protein